MASELKLQSLPYKLPKKLELQIQSSENYSKKLDLVRNWVHTNNTITHKKRLEWHQPLIKIAQKHNLYDCEAVILTNITKIYDRLGQFESALKSIKRAQKIWKQLSLTDSNYFHNLIIAYCDEAVTLRLQNRIDIALSTLYEGYELIKSDVFNNKEPLIVLLSDLGIIYKEILDYPAALNLFNETLKLIDESSKPDNYIQNKILCHINLGNVHRESDSLILACKEYEKAIYILNNKSEFHQYLIIANINLGQTLLDLKKYKKSLMIYNSAMVLCKDSGSSMDLGFIYLLIAEIYFEIQNFTLFETYLKKGKKLVQDSKYPSDLLFLNKLLFKNYVKKGKRLKGIKLLLESLDICKKNQMHKHSLKVCKTLSDAYSDENDIINALKYSKMYILEKDKSDKRLHSLFLHEKQQTLNRMQEEIRLMKQKEEKKIIEIELEFKRKELISKKLHDVSSNDFLGNIYKSLKNLSSLDPKIKNVVQNCEQKIANISSWEDYLNTYEEVNPKFMESLRKLSDLLSATEIRVCSLIHLGLDNYEIAKFMSVSKRSIEQHRYRIKKKLNINQNLTEYIFTLT